MKQAVFGIIGVGNIAQSQHLPNLARAPHINLKTVCDLRKDVLEQMQKKYGVPEAETDHKKLLSDPEIDAVVIATKSDMQAPLSVEALEAGKHVYVEKPLAETPDDVEAVVAAQKASGKMACVGFNRRMAPAYRKADVLLAADCVPFAVGDFHARFLQGKSLAIACPKLDEGQDIYLEKLISMIDEAEINTLNVVVMQVPCCSGLVRLAVEAQKRAKRKIPVKGIIVSLQGEILNEEWIQN